ncbi:bifunctional 2-polyprenyl-6-hydroxyphenol methylase/3-demethylubiquinol 3-O-methyltransferase UbiG [Tropicimonas sp. IMCC6043]|uniref:class I SAM-dependent methyltransferase n=1 Tax=Tropicimonas sp. IMCC6043 TaxID=2510645 RepID=UPI00101C7572|nr:class I SAM-dependent methyltransferase [Tropicimonas sp. IMCC6043]RYH09096.1 class I SAM-dependent methyltransferase [Tropicimonas sp. IMCC6043]
MDKVQRQYEDYPYPDRDPAEETRRLIVGSPSFPVELDHHLFGGKRDWAAGTSILVAGGGTGDGLVQLAQILTRAGVPHEITYLDLSAKAREVAEARVAARGLKGIRFHTDSLLNANHHGTFDYIDCCGVLHHLPDPQAGFDALAASLAPGGGIGLMVYAPHGRAGVYPLQDALNAVTDGLSPKDAIAAARQILERVPDGHPFKRNPHLVDHMASDAGFLDLLLHGRDRPYTVTELHAALDRAGLACVAMVPPAQYDPSPYLPDGLAPDLGPVATMQLAENLRGTIKVHIAYATWPDRAGEANARPRDLSIVPHLKGVAGPALAKAIAAKGQVRVTLASEAVRMQIPKKAAPLVATVDGRTPLSAIAARARLDPVGFGALWSEVDRALSGWGILHYSRLPV